MATLQNYYYYYPQYMGDESVFFLAQVYIIRNWQN